MQSDQSFLALENPNFDLTSLRLKPKVKPYPTSLLAIPLREALVIQPALSNSDRLPRTLILPEDKPALTVFEYPNYTYRFGPCLYTPVQHDPMYDLVFNELYDANFTTTHSTTTTMRLGCKGPLCRRARNIQRFISTRLRETRHTSERYSHEDMMRKRYAGLIRNQPSYAAVEPLLELLSLWAHELRRPQSPDQLSAVYMKMRTVEQWHSYLRLIYGSVIELGD